LLIKPAHLSFFNLSLSSTTAQHAFLYTQLVFT
jgi:hypothetical protein